MIIRARVHTRYMRPSKQHCLRPKKWEGKERKGKGRAGEKDDITHAGSVSQRPGLALKNASHVSKVVVGGLKEAMTWLDTKVAEALLCLYFGSPGTHGCREILMMPTIRMDECLLEIRQNVGCNFPSSMMEGCLAP